MLLCLQFCVVLVLVSLANHVTARGVAVMGHGSTHGNAVQYEKKMPCNLMRNETMREECEANESWRASDIPVWTAPVGLGLVLTVFGLLIGRICWVRHQKREEERLALDSRG